MRRGEQNFVALRTKKPASGFACPWRHPPALTRFKVEDVNLVKGIVRLPFALENQRPSVGRKITFAAAPALEGQWANVGEEPGLARSPAERLGAEVTGLEVVGLEIDPTRVAAVADLRDPPRVDFRLGGFYGCTEQECWSLDHPESRELWRPPRPQCVDRWCASSFTRRGSILQWHLVTRAARHISHRNPVSLYAPIDKASHGTSGADLQLHRDVGRAALSPALIRHPKR